MKIGLREISIFAMLLFFIKITVADNILAREQDRPFTQEKMAIIP